MSNIIEANSFKSFIKWQISNICILRSMLHFLLRESLLVRLEATGGLSYHGALALSGWNIDIYCVLFVTWFSSEMVIPVSSSDLVSRNRDNIKRIMVDSQLRVDVVFDGGDQGDLFVRNLFGDDVGLLVLYLFFHVYSKIIAIYLLS